jgi:hypothetical protein
MILFNSFQQTRADIQFLKFRPPYAGKNDAEAGRDARRRAWFRLVMQALVTFFCFGMGSYLLFHTPTSEDKVKLGYFLIGTGVGFWLR